jgi:mannose-6-phosphate isomerase-like protein (cupin superfamily)
LRQPFHLTTHQRGVIIFIRDIKDCEPFLAGDGTAIRELFNPATDDGLDLRYSFAEARLAPGRVSLLHRLKTSEVYYILSGEGLMSIDGETSTVTPGQIVYIPPGATQCITSTGESELVFICIVDPAWRVEDEEVLE